MRVIEYFTSENKAHWLAEIGKCDWGAGQYLYSLLRDGKLKDTIGQTTLVLMLTEGDRLLAFCTLSPLDDVQPSELSPWIGFVYTFPEHRGQGLFGRLLEYAESIAEITGKDAIYISTNLTAFYERYGFEFYREAIALDGDPTRIYRKPLTEPGSRKDARRQAGDANKRELVMAARKGIDPIAYCGFTCNNCFLGEWCGGCRSVYCCCSFATLSEPGGCANAACCRDKGIDGCYLCDELTDCEKGFYAPDNDGSAACKAGASFIKKHGKESYLAVMSKLMEHYGSKELQELLDSAGTQEAVRIMEKQLS